MLTTIPHCINTLISHVIKQEISLGSLQKEDVQKRRLPWILGWWIADSIEHCMCLPEQSFCWLSSHEYLQGCSALFHHTEQATWQPQGWQDWMTFCICMRLNRLADDMQARRWREGLDSCSSVHAYNRVGLPMDRAEAFAVHSQAMRWVQLAQTSPQNFLLQMKAQKLRLAVKSAAVPS